MLWRSHLKGKNKLLFKISNHVTIAEVSEILDVFRVETKTERFLVLGLFYFFL